MQAVADEAHLAPPEVQLKDVGHFRAEHMQVGHGPSNSAGRDGGIDVSREAVDVGEQ